MTHYFINFVTYTFAVCGLLLAAMFIYRRATTAVQGGKSADFLRIEHRLDMSARRSLYVVKAGHERFLIATDTDKTTFLSKLEDTRQEIPTVQNEQKEEVSAFSNIVNFDKTVIQTENPNKSNRTVKNFKLDEKQMPVLKSLLRKMEGK